MSDVWDELAMLRAEIERLKDKNRHLKRLLSDCHDALPNWKTGRNDGLLAELADALEQKP